MGVLEEAQGMKILLLYANAQGKAFIIREALRDHVDKPTQSADAGQLYHQQLQYWHDRTGAK